MKAKDVCLAAVVFFSLLFSPSKSFTQLLPFASSTSEVQTQTAPSYPDDYKYVIVVIDGINWVYVYGPNGNVVDFYKEYE